MIRKLIRQMLTAQIFSALTVSLCLLIDSIMISRFLGEKAIAARRRACYKMPATCWQHWLARLASRLLKRRMMV